jgi:hypothetical protein
MTGPLVIVGCGARKRDRPAPAADLYTGPYFRACVATATAIAPRDHVFILSARYGLLALDDPADPYDLTLGQPGAIDARQLAAQAAERAIIGRPVTALCGGRYAALARQVWADVTTPLAGLGIGRQRHVLAVMRTGGREQAPSPAGRGDGAYSRAG